MSYLIEFKINRILKLMEESKQSAQSRASKLQEIMGRVKDREISQKKQ